MLFSWMIRLVERYYSIQLESRKITVKKIASNFIYQASYQILLIFLPIITVPVVSKALGPTGVGTWNYINSIVTYFTMVAGLGLSNYGVREIALAKKNGNVSSKFWELQLFNSFFCLIIIFVYIVFSLFMRNRLLFLIQTFALLGSLFDISWFFSGLENFKQITIRSFLIKVISFFCIVFFVKNSNDIYLYFLIQSLSIFFSELSLWFFLKGKVIFTLPKIDAIFSHMKPALIFFIPKISQTIYYNMNKTILGVMTTMAVVGYYSNANLLVKMAGTIVLSLNTVLLPKMTSYYGENNTKKMIELLSKTLHFQMYLTIPIMFGIIAINTKMVGWFFGEAFAPLVTIVPILAPIVVLQTLHAGIATQFLVPSGDIRSYNISAISAAIISIFLNIILIPFFGVYGACIAYLFSQIVLVAVRVHALRAKTNFKFDVKLVLKFLSSGFFMLGVIFLFTKNLSPSPITTFIQIIIGISTYFLCTYLLKANLVLIYLIKIGKV